ncbi:MAG: IS66 family transposase [Deltaproteobacteria bacterium]|nr:IS66 family transposase [Deltaproteobacteria bacterium]
MEAQLAERDQRVEELQGQLLAASRQLYGQKSEQQRPRRRPRVDPVERARRRKRDPEERREAAARARAANRAARGQLAVEDISIPVPAEQQRCPHCGDEVALQEVGGGRVTTVYEFVPAHFVQRRYHQQVLACPRCDHIVSAPAPDKPIEKGLYGASLVAHVVASKCADALPIHRLARRLGRQGLAIGRSTLNDLFHAAAGLLRPLRDRMLGLVAGLWVVFADETTMPVQAPERTRTAYLWTFIGRTGEGEDEGALVTFRFAPSRSGETPSAVLGKSAGYLVVDGYTGYNVVCTPKCRKRGGCWSHCRRNFFDALPTAPEAQAALDLIGALYEVEYEAAARGILGTAEHLALRRAASTPVLKRLKLWLREQKPLHTPKSPMGKAIRYAQRQWRALLRFLREARVPLDNNVSERQLRAAALGRKNFLFVGHDKAGDNLAVLYSLVSSCIANDVNPEEYLADVLVRVHHHPQSRIDELLPHRWKKLFAVVAAA